MRGERREERGEGSDQPAVQHSAFSVQHSSLSPSLAIIGGGLSGLAAAVAAVERGFRVELFEQAKTLGGRAGSFVDSESGATIDYCQHVAMGCCLQFLDFCRRTGIDDCFDRSNKLHFIGPEGTRHDFAPGRWLPVPLHLLPGLMGLSYLSWRERLGIIMTLGRLVRQRVSPLSLGEGLGVRAKRHGPLPNPLPKGEGTFSSDEETIGDWLRRQNQSDRIIERFWSVVLVSALGETVDHASLAAAQKVFRDGFLASRHASDLVLPRRPLGEIFHERLGEWLADRGVKIHLSTPIRRIEGRPPRVQSLALADGEQREFDFTIVAVPWQNVKPLFAESILAAIPSLADVEQIDPVAITAVHLWFDRPMAAIPHAVLVDRLSQWVFFKPENYCQVVISASHRLPERKHDALVAEVCRELEAVWPAMGAQIGPAPRLLHSRVVTQPSAVFSVQPGVDRFRPQQQTPIDNLALAGDWTATSWPATMEGAVRSGFLAVEALFQELHPKGPVTSG